jgi:hypothetical protein
MCAFKNIPEPMLRRSVSSRSGISSGTEETWEQHEDITENIWSGFQKTNPSANGWKNLMTIRKIDEEESSDGVYYCRLQADDFVQTNKLLLMR